MGDSEEVLGSKYSIEIENIFGNNGGKPSGKLLVIGKAGVGKTTLMHFISYQWSKGKLWSDDFNYVFRIRLKDLTNEGWTSSYKK